MNNKTIYVLHEYGACSHYNALIFLAQQHGYQIKFYEFSLLTLLKWVLNGNYSFRKWLSNVLILCKIPFMSPVKIVLGIAPYNKYLVLIMWLLKRHQVYYHTSYTHWDNTMMAHPTKSQYLIGKWKYFTNRYVKHIFAVSEQTKKELIANEFSTSTQISVVYHSYKLAITPNTKSNKNNNFIFVGRLTEQKGIKELLAIFAVRKNATLILVGEGDEVNMVKKFASSYDNIIYKGYINKLENIIPIYHSASFLLMNSHRTQEWEELFGISIIEGMSCGCVPITTDHLGPKEIITPNYNGFIYKEGEIEKGIDKAISLSNIEYQEIRRNAIEVGQRFTSEKISKLWSKINLK